MESTERAAKQEQPGVGPLGPEAGIEHTPEELDAAFSEAVLDVDRQAGEVKVGHLKVERVAQERGGALLQEERAENDTIAAEADQVVATQKEALSAWGDLDTTPSPATEKKAWGDVDMSPPSEAAAAAAAALEFSRAKLEGKDVPAKPESTYEELNEVEVDVDAPSENVLDMTAAEIAAASLALEASMPQSPEQAAANLDAAKNRMDMSRVAVNDAKNALKKFEGLGKLRTWTAAGKAERADLALALEEAQKGFEKARGEYVGADALRMLEDRMQQAKDQAANIAMEKGFLARGFERAHEMYKTLGKYDASWATGYTPDNRVGRAMMKALSARTIVSAGLLGLGAAAGAASAVGIGAIFTRRVLAGVGASAGSYDLMRMAADRSLDAFQPSAKELESMDDAEIIEKMERLEARALLGGKPVDKDAVYMRMKQEAGKRLDAVLMNEDDETKQALLELYASERDFNVSKEMQSRSRKETGMKVGAAAIGTFIGSGTMARMFGEATRWAFGGGEAAAENGASAPAAEAAAAQSVVDMAPPQEQFVSIKDAEPSVSTDSLSEVRKGDGYVKIFARQMEADPAKYGYDAAKDGDAHKWAMKTANKVAREQGLMGEGLGYDAANPAHVRLNADFTVENSGARGYTHARFDAGTTVDADASEVSVRAPSDTLSHVETYVDADGTPYYQHDWKQFKFDTGIPEHVREEVARSIDLHGKQIQAMTGMMEDARAKYGREEWFNKFDLMMQKQIRGSYVDWRHEMRQAAGVDKGIMFVNQHVPDGDPKAAAKAVFEATRAAGGFPAMDLGTPSVAEKAFDAVTGGPETSLPVEDIRTAHGSAHFSHDAKGYVTMTYEMKRGLEDVQFLKVKPDWREVLAEKMGDNWSDLQVTAAESELARIDMETEIHRTMVENGQGDSAEGKWLARMIVRRKINLVRRYGDLLAE